MSEIGVDRRMISPPEIETLQRLRAPAGVYGPRTEVVTYTDAERAVLAAEKRVREAMNERAA